MSAAPASSREAIHVACGCDENYVPHLAQMVYSLCAHTKGRPIHVHVMDGGLSAPARAYLLQVAAQQNQRLGFLEIDVTRLQHLRLTEWFSFANYYRMLLPELLPEIERVLYLDSDITVVDDVAPLWDAPLNGHAIGAVANVLHPKNPQDHVANLGLARAADYLNSGVLLMDLAAMRRERLTEQLMNFAAEHPRLMLYADQDAFNGVLKGRWQRLHPRWNVQTTMLEVEPEQQPLQRDELDEALRKPGVIHYMGWWKPWRLWSNHPLRGEYRRHRRRLPRPVHSAPKTFATVLEYYFPGWVLLAYHRWRPRATALLRGLGLIPRTAP